MITRLYRHSQGSGLTDLVVGENSDCPTELKEDSIWEKEDSSTELDVPRG